MSFFRKILLPGGVFFFAIWTTIVLFTAQADAQQFQKIIDSYCEIVPDSKGNDIYSPYSKEELFALVKSATILTKETVPIFHPHDLSEVINEKNFLLFADHFTPNFSLTDKQQKAIQQFKNVSVEHINFGNHQEKESALKGINDEVSRFTKGKIDNFFDLTMGDERTILIAANVVYLKNGWGVMSDAHSDINFKDEKGTFEKKAHAFLLDASGQIRYAKKKDAYEIFSIPLQNKRLEVQIVLPAQGKTPDSLLRTPGLFSEMMAYIEQASLLDKTSYQVTKMNKSGESKKNSKTSVTENISLVLPKFFIKKHYDLSAHISGLSPWLTPLIFQDAFIKVDENGVEAGAATGAVVNTSIRESHEVVIDRPFAFWVLDTQTDTLLFVGTVYHPEYEK